MDNRQHGPLVSVLIPVYNAGKYLRSSVEGIINQTYSNLEIIILDDGSTDGCMESIQDINDQRVNIFHQENAGKSVALNMALQHITGKYYCIQDADDLCYPERIEKMVNAMEIDESLAALFSGYDLIINEKMLAPIFAEKSIEQCEMDINSFCMPSHDPTGMYRVSIVKGVEYDPELRIGQGYDYILKVGEKYPMKALDECLYSYRINFDSNTRLCPDRRVQMIKKVWQKTCCRRDLNFEMWLRKNSSKINSVKTGVQYGVVPHFMESVLRLRIKGRWGKAMRTALLCIKLHPLDPRYYKPLAYFVAPLSLITYYRSMKKRIKDDDE